MWKYLLLCFFGILACFVACTVARVAIVGGHLAGGDQFPYQVSVMAVSGHNVCGGGILSDFHVLTAAHCVIDDDDDFKDLPMYILAGTNDVSGTSVRTVRIQVKKIYVPKEYKHPPHTSHGDIAILKLIEALKLDSTHKYLKSVHLPKNIHETYAEKTAMIAGFGYTWVRVVDKQDIGGHNDSILRYAEADILSHDECHKVIPEHKTFSQKHVCARVKQGHDDSRAHGVCIGDSGSPLVHDNTVVGVLSSSPLGCSEKLYPALYTRVTEYLDFIYNAMKDRTKDIRTTKLL